MKPEINGHQWGMYTASTIRFLNMRDAGMHIGQSYRWMQRNYIALIKDGVKAFRVPRESPKGRLVFEKDSLDKYMEKCRIDGSFETVG